MDRRTRQLMAAGVVILAVVALLTRPGSRGSTGASGTAHALGLLVVASAG